MRRDEPRAVLEILHAERHALERPRLAARDARLGLARLREQAPRAANMATTAFSAGFAASMRSSTACISSTGESFFACERSGEFDERELDGVGHGATSGPRFYSSLRPGRLDWPDDLLQRLDDADSAHARGDCAVVCAVSGRPPGVDAAG